ncbi:MAG: DRTGG domain-containing protein [Bacillota bacterium]|nr:DRTGG domain-containing protein [Bacillota bacterium]HOK70032.1 DRTGG domain-containing protein [Bacillota bacterium]HOL50894.1 DRTGG domain-containing protein [Bacillota bacterium]HOO29707.1 DRTGG domain-containing protein [Bacillota bacterium]HPZ13017.1 DRTGG domain-containing protein [Bacillota bacterium]
MTVREIAAVLGMKCVAGGVGLDREVSSGYVSDLLSDVMANASDGGIWVTSQVHQNVVAVALLLDLAAVVIAGGLEMNEDAIARAEAEGMPILSTKMSAFETVGRLYELGVRGDS